MKAGPVALALLCLSAAAAAGARETFAPEKAVLDPFPREIPSHGTITFVATLKAGYSAPILSVTHPDGTTEYHRPDRTPTGVRYEFQVVFASGDGEYRLELVVDSSRGDTSAAQFSVWAGVKREKAAAESNKPRPESDYPPESKEEDPVRLERDLMRRINDFRQEEKLEPYPWLEKAAILARAHLRDYLALKPRPKKLTHIIPGPDKGSIADRFQSFFGWPETVRKFPVAEPEIGPEAICYCSESLAAVRSLDWLFNEYYLRESAFRAPIISTFPTHAAVGIVREPGTGRLYTATVFVQVNSTRVLSAMKREFRDLERAEEKARSDEDQAEALRRLARYAAPGCVRLFTRRLRDHGAAVRAAALDGLILNDFEAAEEQLGDMARVLARAHARARYGPARPILETWSAVLYDAKVRKRGRAELAAISDASEAALRTTLSAFLSSPTPENRADLEEVALRYHGWPAGEIARAKLDAAPAPSGSGR